MIIRGDHLKNGIANATQTYRKEALKAADYWSAGPIKQRVLTKMGHPYARRHLSYLFGNRSNGGTRKVYGLGRVGAGFPARINAQRGLFRHGWKVRQQKRGGDEVLTLLNLSPDARWLTQKGTRKMIGRPVLQAIVRDIRKRTKRLYKDAFKKAMKLPSVSPNMDAAAAYAREMAVTPRGGMPNSAAMRAAFRRGFTGQARYLRKGK